jgi:hypothetical protein
LENEFLVAEPGVVLEKTQPQHHLGLQRWAAVTRIAVGDYLCDEAEVDQPVDLHQRVILRDHAVVVVVEEVALRKRRGRLLHRRHRLRE